MTANCGNADRNGQDLDGSEKAARKATICAHTREGAPASSSETLGGGSCCSVFPAAW